MFTFNVDLGQLIIVGMIGVVGYFVKRTIDSFESKIQLHEKVIFEMNGNLQLVIGSLGIDRRLKSRDR